MLRPDVVIAVFGVLILVAAVAGASRPEIPPAERRAFRAVNGLPDGLFWIFWAPMQLGNLVVARGLGEQLRKRYPQSPEALAFDQGRFNE